MKNLISNAIANSISFVKQIRLDRLFATILVIGVLLFTSNVNAAQANESLGERVKATLERTDGDSQRPKTVGQFKAEADGDVPLGERAGNIARDSAQSLKQMSEQYPTLDNKKESDQNLAGKAVEAGKNLLNLD